MKLKHVLFVLVALMVNAVMGGTLSAAVGISPVVGAVTLNAVAAVSPLFSIQGLRAGLYTELWTGETIKAFRNSAESLGWLSKIPSFDSQVEKNNTINFADLGGDPTVLVNNSSYPLGIESLEDANKAIGLDCYETQPTRVSDKEIRGLSYDKKSTVIERHRDSVDEKKFARALHALAPDNNGEKTPVLLTTGADYKGRKRLTVQDVINLKEQFDDLKVPKNDRILVLCPQHVNDLLIQDTTFAQRYNNTEKGKVINQYGFEIYEYVDVPRFNVNTLEKVSFTASAAATDALASVAFYAPRMMKATGETKAYIDEPDTQYHDWRYNIMHYFICLPKKKEAIGAIVTAKASAPVTISGADNVTLKATATAAQRTFATSNGANVTASTEAAWLTVAASGKTVTFTPTAYAHDAEGDDPRTATVVVGVVGSAGVTKEVTVSQPKAAS